MTFKIPTPKKLQSIMDRHRFTQREMGEALGFSDAARVINAVLLGRRNDKPYGLSSPATSALNYMLALHGLVAAHAAYREDQTPDNEERLTVALENSAAILPKRLRPAGVATNYNSPAAERR